MNSLKYDRYVVLKENGCGDLHREETHSWKKPVYAITSQRIMLTGVDAFYNQYRKGEEHRDQEENGN